jgi:hypothetical protein
MKRGTREAGKWGASILMFWRTATWQASGSSRKAPCIACACHGRDTGQGRLKGSSKRMLTRGRSRGCSRAAGQGQQVKGSRLTAAERPSASNKRRSEKRAGNCHAILPNAGPRKCESVCGLQRIEPSRTPYTHRGSPVCVTLWVRAGRGAQGQ